MTTHPTSGAADLPKATTTFCWATELAITQEPVTLSVSEAREISAEMQRLHALAAGQAVAPADRTPQDFAIEFAEYMAKGAEALITAINADAEVRLRIAESDDVSDDDQHDVEATVSEMQRALRSDIYEFRKRRDRAASAPATTTTFQKRVQPWLLECFGAEIAADRVERNHRFLEEALELVQALGCTASEAHQLVDYVYGRPVGEPAQEAGGVMVTLAALCLASGLDMHQAGQTELARISAPDQAAKIRAKQAAKPKHSPLPVAQQVAARDAAPLTWPKARDVGRIGDMSPSAHLRVGFDSDNDVFVSVWDERGGASLEFCNPGGGGGGQSSRTRLALIALMVAMEADNAEKPSRDWWALRMDGIKGGQHGTDT